MKLIADRRGHVVYVRSPTPNLWEAACECGYRSPRTAESIAVVSGHGHAESAPEIVAAKRKPAKRRAKTARKK